jgi:hypothetical protein
MQDKELVMATDERSDDGQISNDKLIHCRNCGVVVPNEYGRDECFDCYLERNDGIY